MRRKNGVSSLDLVARDFETLRNKRPKTPRNVEPESDERYCLFEQTAVPNNSDFMVLEVDDQGVESVRGGSNRAVLCVGGNVSHPGQTRWIPEQLRGMATIDSFTRLDNQLVCVKFWLITTTPPTVSLFANGAPPPGLPDSIVLSWTGANGQKGIVQGKLDAVTGVATMLGVLSEPPVLVEAFFPVK